MLNLVIDLLESRAIAIDDITSLIHILKESGKEDVYDYRTSILNTLSVKEVSDFIILGIILDIYAENSLLPDPLQYMTSGKDHMFELNTLLSLSILNEFGPEAVIHYSYLKREQMSLIRDLVSQNSVNTFLIDILCLIAAASSVELH